MNIRNSKYYKVLSESKDEKMEILESVQFAKQKLFEIRNENPDFFNLIRSLQPLVKAIKPINDFIKPLKEVNEAISGYVEYHLNLSDRIQVLATYGWYFSMEFIDALDVEDVNSLIVENPALFENKVIEVFESKLKDIQGKLTYTFPKRTQIFNRIAELHRLKDYIASIPLTLTQADGICKDVFFVTGKKGDRIPVGFFESETNKSNLKRQHLSKSFKVPKTSLFTVLTNQLAISDRNKHLLLEGNTKKLSDLNRHAILHGESVDYGTYINSVKAILLLDFIADLHLMNEVISEKKYED